ncbi:MAG: cupin domain-containing protein [bacterium]
MNHVVDMLHDWFLGALSDAESEKVESHLDACETCRVALNQHVSLLTTLEAPGPMSGLDRLLAEATTLRRFERFALDIARIADVTVDRAKGWLASIDDAASWVETAMHGLELFHIEGGPAVEGAIVGFVKLQGGVDFPEHTHLGQERIFIVQGRMRDEDGRIHGPGTLVERDPASTHAISAEPGIPLIYLNVVHEGLEIFGMKFGPAEF